MERVWQVHSVALFQQKRIAHNAVFVSKKEQQNLEGPAIDREKVWQKTFGKSAFDEAKLRYAFSDLAKLLERFIAVRELDKNKLRHNQLLLEYYSSKDIEKYFNQIFDDSQNFSKKWNSWLRVLF